MITILFRLLMDMVIGALIFVVIGLVALGLHLFTEWLGEEDRSRGAAE